MALSESLGLDTMVDIWKLRKLNPCQLLSDEAPRLVLHTWQLALDIPLTPNYDYVNNCYTNMKLAINGAEISQFWKNIIDYWYRQGLDVNNDNIVIIHVCNATKVIY